MQIYKQVSIKRTSCAISRIIRKYNDYQNMRQKLPDFGGEKKLKFHLDRETSDQEKWSTDVLRRGETADSRLLYETLLKF